MLVSKCAVCDSKKLMKEQGATGLVSTLTETKVTFLSQNLKVNISLLIQSRKQIMLQKYKKLKVNTLPHLIKVSSQMLYLMQR